MTTSPKWDIHSWRIYYPDQEINSSASSWVEAPTSGVQVIVLYLDAFATDTEDPVRYRKLLDGYDYYYHIPGTDVFGETDDRDEIPDDAVVKLGREIPDDEFDAIKQEAVDSPWR